MQAESNIICCPECGSKEDVYIEIVAKEATIKAPISANGFHPAFEILREVYNTGGYTFVAYSDVSGKTRISFRLDDLSPTIHCVKCNKAYDLPEGVVLQCVDVE